jgi:hypothetical protein
MFLSKPYTLDSSGKNAVAKNNPIIEWKLDQEPQCMICRKEERDIWGGLEVHHMVPRSLAPSLREERANFLLVCRICHMRCENMHVVNEATQRPLDPIDLATQLYFKSCNDPRDYSPKKLKKHYRNIPNARKQKCLE